MRITWRREKRETGLRAMTQGERGYEIYVDGVMVGAAKPLFQPFLLEVVGYYWYLDAESDLGIPKTHSIEVGPCSLFKTIDEAKAGCRAYLDNCLAQK